MLLLGGGPAASGARKRSCQRHRQRSSRTGCSTSRDNCMACHNGLTTSAGEDISIGTAWRATMMANSARDPTGRRRPARGHGSSRRRPARSKTSAPRVICRWRGHSEWTGARERCSRTSRRSRRGHTGGEIGRRRRVVHDVSPDHDRPFRHAGQLHRRIRRRSRWCR